MAISQAQKIDLLFKQAFGVTKTDLETNKSPSNESIASPLIVPTSSIWRQSDSIPKNQAAAVVGIVQEYTGATAVECVADTTTVPVGGIYPTWKTNLADWVPVQFHSSYLVKVYVDDPGAANPELTGTQIFAAGTNSTGEYYFDPSSGVLNFIGGTIPAILTSGKKIYIAGFRYIGSKGLPPIPSANCIGYEHEQTIASDTWTITHGNNSTKVVASVYDENAEQIIPDFIKIINSNTVTVKFSSSISGKAMIISF